MRASGRVLGPPAVQGPRIMGTLDGWWSPDSTRSPQNRVPKFVAPKSCSDRRIRSRTFPGFRPIYPRGSDANCTKPHRSVHLYRPGTLLEQGAGCCISDTKIQGRVAISSHPLTHAKPAADFQHGESKAIQSHLRFRMIRLRKERFSHRLRKQFIHFRR